MSSRYTFMSMIPPVNNRLHISAASLIISGELLPARFPPISTSSRDISLRMLAGQVTLALKLEEFPTRPLPETPLEYPAAVYDLVVPFFRVHLFSFLQLKGQMKRFYISYRIYLKCCTVLCLKSLLTFPRLKNMVIPHLNRSK